MTKPMDRRAVLGLFAAGGAWLAGARPVQAADEEGRLAVLIRAAADLPTVGQRMEFISAGLLGTPYRGFTLIGGPHEAERFVMRDDGFDCVTFCETVLAAARVFDPAAYAASLRHIRYRDGDVAWRERNHYWSDWSEANCANGVCRAVALPGAVMQRKTITYMPELGGRQLAVRAMSASTLAAHRERLVTGDIVGFLSRRPGLDYFHTGMIVIEEDGTVLLRHAAKSQKRVLDERLSAFMAANRVQRVTLLRPQEPWVESSVV